MYLRTTRRRNADGSEVRYYQLAENEWNPDKRCAVAKVIYNFGRADQLDVDKLRRLAKSILRAVSGEDQLITQVQAEAAATGEPDVRLRDAWPFGGVYVLQQLWKELEIDDVLRSSLRKSGVKQPFDAALFAMVANRALQPSSKLYCFDQWLREDVFLPGAQQLELQHLYRAMDFLEDNKEQVEKAVFFSVADLMNADVDVIFYDTTSLHFEVEQEDDVDMEHHDRDYEPLRKRGHSKNGRGDAPQIVVGLAITRDGLPVRSWVLPGNTADITTVERVKNDLRGWRLGRCVFVGDAGMNSEQNRRTLALGGGKYILASRIRAGDEVTTDVLRRPGRYRTVAGNLRVKQVIVGDGARQRRYVVCHNPDEQTRQQRHRAKLLDEVQAELAAMKPSTRGHSKRMCELLSSARFGRYLKESKGGLMVNWRAVREAERFDGKWVITSNDDTLTPEDLALGYKQLLRVEQCWRQLKGGVRMRPVFHWRPWRIQAHVTISVLALLLERIVEIRTGMTWRNVRDELQALKVVEYDRGDARIQQTTELRFTASELLHKLGVPPPPKLHSVQPVPTNETDRVEAFDQDFAAAHAESPSDA